MRRTGRFRSAVRWFVADLHAALAMALAIPILVVEAAHGFAEAGPVLGSTLAYLGLQLGLAIVVGHRRRGWIATLRFVIAIGFVGLLSFVEPRTETTLPVLYIPIITLAAATERTATALVVALAAAATSRAVILIQAGPEAALAQSLLPISVVVFLILGTRAIVASLERSLERLRRILAAERRQARRHRAIEQVGRILAADGPTDAALQGVMDVLEGPFGYHYPSVYLLDNGRLRLGAQRGYAHPILEFDLDLGIIGRVARTREPVFAPDVRREPEYAEADAAVVSEISVPLLVGGELLGVLNVESTAAEPLDRGDYASMLAIADRLATSIALGRERRKLAERAGLLGRLTTAFQELAGTLDPSALHARIALASTTVVTCDVAVLILREPVTGEYRVASAHGTERSLGMQIEPGEGASGRAIAERRIVLENRFQRGDFSRVGLQAVEDAEVAIMAIPLLGADEPVGAMTLVRHLPGEPFTDQEREIASLMASQVVLALANAALHADTAEQAIRDPLTRLHNRRLLDDSLTRMSAARARQRPEDRRPFAAILFDLDHFGEFNNRHGHVAGDAVLRAFAGILASRFRSSDLVARYGGEEFLVILDGASREDAMRSAEEVRRTFGATTVPGPGGISLQATVSAGCAALDAGVADLGAMIEVADVGLAMAKAGGRDQVVAA